MSQYPPGPPGPPQRKAIPAALAAMPAYTVGMLTPVPFFVAALRLRLRWLWLITAVYGAVWVAAWVLVSVTPDDGAGSDLAGGLLIALAAAGTAHAFVLREKLPRSQRQFAAYPPQLAAPSAAPVEPAGMVADDDEITVTHLRAALVSLQSYIATYATAFPPACKRLLDEIIGQLDQVVTFVANNGHADTELRSVHAMLTDYLPTSINTFVRLPREFATTQPNPDGRTAAEELELQLGLLRQSAEEAANSLYRGDALRLQEQSAFLRAKFGTSSLDLP